jgi:O-succinylbenzoate synthase
LRLERIEVRRLTLPLRTPFETSFGRTDVKQFLLVCASADGVTGLGECVADIDPFYLPETNETALHVLRDFLAPIALGLEISDPRELLPAFARVRGHEMAKAALEMAVFELWARRSGQPLWAPAGWPARRDPVGRLDRAAARRRSSRRNRGARGGGGLPARQDQDQARPRPRPRRGRCGGASPSCR